MQCMEVWGGNQPADSAVVMAGLDAWVYSKPFGQSDGGGDVYYVSSCATGRVTRLLLADVSGHGAAVAELARALRRLMQRYVNFIDQSAFVRSMNEQFTQLSDDGCFATAIVSTFFAPTNDLTLCIAGHPPPLLYHAATKQWKFAVSSDSRTATNLPLGIDNLKDWAQFGLRLDVGDLVLCYTDSLIESRDAQGELLGTVGLLDIVDTLDVSDPKSVIPSLLRAIASRHVGNLGDDDVTALLFRPNGLAPQVPLKQKFCAPLRVIRGVMGSVLPAGAPAPWPEMSLPNIGGAMFRSLNRLWSRKNAH